MPLLFHAGLFISAVFRAVGQSGSDAFGRFPRRAGSFVAVCLAMRKPPDGPARVFRSDIWMAARFASPGSSRRACTFAVMAAFALAVRPPVGVSGRSSFGAGAGARAGSSCLCRPQGSVNTERPTSGPCPRPTATSGSHAAHPGLPRQPRPSPERDRPSQGQIPRPTASGRGGRRPGQWRGKTGLRS